MVGPAEGPAAGWASRPRGLQGHSHPQQHNKVALPGNTGSLSPRERFPLLSREAASLMDSHIRTSTKNVYKSRIENFKLYCEDLGCPPHAPPPEVVANFLAILSEILNFQYQTVCGFGSAITKYLADCGNGLDSVTHSVPVKSH